MAKAAPAIAIAVMLQACSADLSRLTYVGQNQAQPASNDLMTGSVQSGGAWNNPPVYSAALPPPQYPQAQYPQAAYPQAQYPQPAYPQYSQPSPVYQAAYPKPYKAPKPVKYPSYPSYPASAKALDYPAAPVREARVLPPAPYPAPRSAPKTRLGWTAAGGMMVTVKSGQTPGSIARQYGIPEDALLQVNGLPANARLMPGTQIVIPAYNAQALAGHPVITPQQAEAPRPQYVQAQPQYAAPAPVRPQYVQAQPQYAAPAPVRPQYVQVQPQYIQPQYVPVQPQYAQPQYVQVLPQSPPQSSVVYLPARTPKPRPLIVAPDATAQLATGSLRPATSVELAGTYIVRSGDTMGSVAAGFGLRARDLAAVNGMRATDNVRIGQKLIIPRRKGAPASATAAAPPPVYVPGAAAPVQVAEAPATVERRMVSDAVAPVQVAFRWPLKGRVMSGYGNKGNGLRNDGINVEAPLGAVIKAAEGGEVVFANHLGGYGNLVLIKHANGYVSAYAYAEELLVHRGDRVERGQSIATVGTPPDGAAPQLHFEIRANNKPVDPVPYLNG